VAVQKTQKQNVGNAGEYYIAASRRKAAACLAEKLSCLLK